MGLTGAFEFFFNPFVALLFEFEGELFGAGFDDTAFVEDMNEVGDYVVEEALVVGDDDGGVVGAAQWWGRAWPFGRFHSFSSHRR